MYGEERVTIWCLQECKTADKCSHYCNVPFCTVTSLTVPHPSIQSPLPAGKHTLSPSLPVLKVEVTTLRVDNCLIAWEFPCPPQRPLLTEDRSNTQAVGDNFEYTHMHTHRHTHTNARIHTHRAYAEMDRGSEREKERKWEERGVPPLAAAMWL